MWRRRLLLGIIVLGLAASLATLYERLPSSDEKDFTSCLSGDADGEKSFAACNRYISRKSTDLSLAFAARCETYRDNLYDKADEAISDCTTAIDLKSNDARYYYYRAEAYEGKHDFDRAIIDYSKAIDISPESITLYESRAQLYDEQKKDYDLAIADRSKIVELSPNNIVPLNYRASIYSRKAFYDLAYATRAKAMEDCDLAIADLKKALQLRQSGNLPDPDHAFLTEDFLNGFIAEIEAHKALISGKPLSSSQQVQP